MTEFDPRNWMIKIQGKDYLLVAGRILWFRDRTDGIGGSITTSIVTANKEWCVCHARAEFTDESGHIHVGEGVAQELSGKFADHVEKASTSAIGRALGALGFGTNDIDFSEGEIVDTPTPREPTNLTQAVQNGRTPQFSASVPRQNGPGPATSGYGITPNQMKFAQALAGERGVDASAVSRNRFGKGISELNRQEASSLIDALKAMPAAQSDQQNMNIESENYWLSQIAQAITEDEVIEVHDKVLDQFGGVSKRLMDEFESRLLTLRAGA